MLRPDDLRLYVSKYALSGWSFLPKTVQWYESLAKKKLFKLEPQDYAAEKHQFFEMDQQ
jgi:hypothetical protein